MAISKIGRNATDTSISDSGDATAISISSGEDVTISAGDIIFGASGKGINLGVTSNTDANTLDDFEEGEWNRFSKQERTTKSNQEQQRATHSNKQQQRTTKNNKNYKEEQRTPRYNK